MNRRDLYEQGQRAFGDWHRTRDQRSLDAAVQAFQAGLALPRSSSDEPGLGQFAMELSAALTEGSEAELPGYTDRAVDVSSKLLERIRNVPPIWTTRGYNRMLRYTRHGSLDDLNGAIGDFRQALSLTTPDDPQVYRRTVNLSWASEARYDRLQAHGEEYRIVYVNGVERWRGPRDLVFPISLLDALLVPDNGHPPPPRDEVPKMKRNLANLLTKYALDVKLRTRPDRVADLGRAVSLLQEAMTETVPGSPDHTSVAVSLVATVEQGRDAGLLPPGA